MRQNGRIELVSDYLTEAVIVKQKHKFESAWRVAKTGGANCGLHPLIHTFIKFNLAHNAVGGQVNEVEKEAPTDQLWPMGAEIR